MIRILKLAALTWLMVAMLPAENKSQETYTVKRGERPPVDLASLPSEAFEKGVLYIKVDESYAGLLDIDPAKVDQSGNVTFGIGAIDALNRQLGAKRVDLLFACGGFSPQYEDRRRAWGFHLWYKLYFEEERDVKMLVAAYAGLKEVTVAEPQYKTRRIAAHNIEADAGLDGQPSQNQAFQWTPDDPSYDQQWHYHNTGQQGGTVDADIDLPEAWELEKGNSSVIVAIEDGGIQYDHPDIAGNMWSGIGYDFVNDDPIIEPDNHGTHVAGTVAAVNNNNIGVSGIAGGSGSNDGVRLMSCQVFNPAGSGGNFHLAPVYAADNGACISQNSWSYTSPGSFNQLVLDAIDYFNTNGGGDALDGGITIYSAGNDNSSDAYYPAYYSGTFAVAATNNMDVRSYYSNYGSWVNISAPGGETFVTERGILSTINNDSYTFYQGTSMACPHTSGVAALVASLSYGSLTAGDVKAILLETADDHYDVNPAYANLLGSGRLNAFQALQETAYYMIGLTNPPTFVADPVSSSQINLSWAKNPNNHDVMIMWAATEVFGTPADGTSYTPGQVIPGGGTVLYSGAGTSVNHTGLMDGTVYYYKAFSLNGDNEYSSGKRVSSSTHCLTVSTLPWAEGFEDVGPTISFTANESYINNLCKWSYSRSATGGRLRFDAGPDYYHSGIRAATLDRNPSGNNNVNYLVAELDLSTYILAEDLELSFYYMHHGEESNPGDRVWIRGSNNDPWIEVYNLFANQGGGGEWNAVSALDVDDLLASASPPQVPGSTFQLRFGQEDDFPTISTTASDGYTFDDILLSGTRLFIWSGSESGDWDIPGNWVNNSIPLADAMIQIPATAANWPVKTGDLVLGTTCSNITLSGSSELTITGDLIHPAGYTVTHSGDGTLTIGGDWTKNGTFNPGNCTVYFIGNTNSSIDAPELETSALTTTFVGGNGQNGAMFDLVALKEVTIKSFDANLVVGTGDVSIYYKPGTWVGFDKNAAAWTLVGTTSVTSVGAGTPTAIPLPVNVTIPEAERYAFYVTSTNTIRYTNGSAVGNLYASDSYLQFYEGCGKSTDLFGNPTFTTRVFNGIIHYDNSSTLVVKFNHLEISKNNATVLNNTDLSISGNFRIAPNAWFTNGSANTVSVAGQATLEADENGMASFIDLGTTTVTGTTSVQQYLAYNPPYQYHGVSAPISDATINTYLDLYLYDYDEPSNNFVNLSMPTTLPLAVGKGYYVTGSDQYTGTTTVTFETTSPSGKLNQDDLLINDFTVDGGDPDFRGFRLIGNPFPCALQWNTNWNLTDMSGWMVVLDNGIARGYHTDGSVFNGGSGIIPSTQGFWARALTTSASLTIPASERVHSSQAFYKDQAVNNYPLVRLQVESNGLQDETAIRFHPQGSVGFDGYYDLSKFSNQEGAPQLYTTAEGLKYAFNVMPADFEDRVIPLHFATGNAGTYQVNAVELENFPGYIHVYLEDLKNNLVTDLTTNPEYTFGYATQDDPHRFNLHFKDSYFGLPESENDAIRIFAHDNRVHILSAPGQPGQVFIFDLLGREIGQVALDGSGHTQFSATQKGFYLVRVVSVDRSRSAKVLLQE